MEELSHHETANGEYVEERSTLEGNRLATLDGLLHSIQHSAFTIQHLV